MKKRVDWPLIIFLAIFLATFIVIYLKQGFFSQDFEKPLSQIYAPVGGPCPSSSEGDYLDSDHGDFPKRPGTISRCENGRWVIKQKDTCINNNKEVREYWRTKENEFTSSIHSCDQNEKCIGYPGAGACKDLGYSCSDTDDQNADSSREMIGRNPGKKGTATELKYGRFIKRGTDYCLSPEGTAGGTLKEYMCVNKRLGSDPIICNSDEKCSQGACVPLGRQ